MHDLKIRDWPAFEGTPEPATLQAAVDILSDGLMIMDASGRILALSLSAERLLGWCTGEVLGQDCDAVIEAVDMGGQPLCPTQDAVAQMLQAGTDRVLGIKAAIRRRDGTRLPCIMNYGVLRDEAGQVTRFVHTFRDITAEEQARREVEARVAELRHERGTLASVMRSMVDGLILVDGERRVTYFNPRAEEILGLEAEEMIGQPFTALCDRIAAAAGDSPPIVSSLEDAVARAEELPVVELTTTQPPLRHIRLRPFPVRDEQGQSLGLGVVVRDITREKESDELKSQLIANISHELRTPLAAIKGCATTLLQSGPRWDGVSRQEFLQIVDEQADKLRALIDNLLEMSRLDAGVLRLQRQPVWLSALVQKVINEARLQARGHRFELDLPADLPVVEADPLRIEQVLRNLLENAMRYSPHGGTVTVFGGAGPDEVKLAVRDEGIGIPPEHLDKIFDRFYQVDHPVVQAAGGSGLGLSICRGIVAAHGGRIWADSTPGQGSTFFFTLPLRPIQPGALQSADRRGQPASFRATPRPAPVPGVSILVVDDDPRTVRFVRANLESDGYRVVVAPDGPTALHLVEAEAPDLLLLDLMLPGLDGYEVCRRVREFSAVPIIMLTARGNEHDKVKAFDLGADDYLTKPFGTNELLARVRAVLRRTRFPEELRSQPGFTCGDLAIDFAQHRVTVRGQPVKLSPTEYKLLYYLASNAGRVLTHESILRKVWGPEYEGSEVELVWVCIRRLRTKIEADPSQPEYILTEPGVGYRFRSP